MAKIERSKGIGEEISVDPVEQIITNLQIAQPLSQAMIRFKETLFKRDFSDSFTDYFRRVNAFDGYNPGDANARGYENDMIGQLCGTVGHLQYIMSTAHNEGRELTIDEIERVRRNFLKAGLMREKSAKIAEKYDEYLGTIHRFEQEQIILLAENVPTIVSVIDKIKLMRNEL